MRTRKELRAQRQDRKARSLRTPVKTMWVEHPPLASYHSHQGAPLILRPRVAASWAD